MNDIIKLITSRIPIYHYSELTHSLVKQITFSAFKPKGKYLLAFFAEHASDNTSQPDTIQEYINRDIGVVYVCDKLPRNAVISPNILYIETGWKWFMPIIFWNPLIFKSVDGFGQGKKVAQQFTEFLENYTFAEPSKEIHFKDKILFDLKGGIGDCLLTTPIIHTFINKYKKQVDVIADINRKDCFQNIGINKFINNAYQADAADYEMIYQLDFGDLLNDYRLDLNKQNRMLGIANVCGLVEEDILIKRPIINLIEKEILFAQETLKGLKKTIFFGNTSARTDTCIPNELSQDIINRLVTQGYKVIVASAKDTKLTNCLNLDKQLSIRQLFAIINAVDVVLTVDTSYYHIATAFNKPTIILMNYFKPHWRCFERQNQTIYTPKWQCYPCVSGQFIEEKDRICNTKSCFYGFDWDMIINNLSSCL